MFVQIHSEQEYTNLDNGFWHNINQYNNQRMLFRTQIKYYFSLSANLAILGLKATVNLDTVRKKYYELAKVYHPDVNKDHNSQNKFTQITKAYKYIVENYQEGKESKPSDERKQDNYKGASKFKNQKRQKTRMEEQQYQDFHQYDAFFKNAKKFRKPRKGEDIYINLNITLKESVLGGNKDVTYTRYQPCSDCASKQFQGCFSCGGKGEIYDRINRQKVRCESCTGKGYKNECLTCLGASYVVKEVKDILYIEKGTKDKTIMKAQFKGHSGYKSDNGHLYITVLVEEDDKFKVDGNNILTEFELDCITATCGGVAMVQTLHGLKQVIIQAGTQSGSQIRIFNGGLKSPFSNRMGDQITKIKIKIPKLSQKQKALLLKLHRLQQ